MIIITVVKNDPDGLLKTYNSVISEIGSGLKCSRWIIKLSSDADVSLKRLSICLIIAMYILIMIKVFTQLLTKQFQKFHHRMKMNM